MKGQFFIQFVILDPWFVLHISWLRQGRNSLPCLPWRPVTGFLSFRFLNNFFALKNRVCPEFTVLNIIFLIIQNFEQLAHALKNRVCPEILHCIAIFLSFRIFEELALALKTEFVMKFFAVFNILFTFRMFEQLLLALKNRVCPEFTVLNAFFILQNFE